MDSQYDDYYICESAPYVTNGVLKRLSSIVL